MDFEVHRGSDENGGVRVVVEGVGGVDAMTMMMVGSGREVATVVGDLVGDVVQAIRTAEKQSFMEAAQGAVEPHVVRLQQVTGKVGADVVQWMQEGGLWRSLLVASVGGVTITTLVGLMGFLMAGLVATVNAVIIAFLMCASAVGAFLAMSCTALAVLYIGVLAATAFAIGTAVVVASSAVLFFTGWILFAWGVWEVTKMSLNFVRGLFGMSSPMPKATPAKAPRHRMLGGFSTQNGHT
ncbi:hypothetical protein M758_UG134700 [Ceratodon purpureus]|nr:hypothetical protein M758_UG134700 [Ceratodon purpureus]